MAAADLITFDELRVRLSELEETRKTAERELETLRGRDEYLEGLERERDALLASLMELAPEASGSLTSEERHQFYKMIGLKVVSPLDGPLEVTWAFDESFVLRDQDQCSCATHDEVDLAVTRPVVALDGRVPFVRQVPQSQGLAPLADPAPVQPVTPA